MTLTADTIKKIVRLARLKIQEEEIAPIAKDISHIIDWVAQLEQVDTNNVKPMNSVNLDTMPLRKDEVTNGNIARQILQNSPQEQLDMFVVPRVVE